MTQTGRTRSLRFLTEHRAVMFLAVSVVLIGGSMIQEPPSRFTILSIGVGVVALFVGAATIGDRLTPKPILVASVAGVVGMVAISVGRFASALVGVPSVLVVQGLGLILAALAIRTGRDSAILARAVAVVAIVAVAAIGLLIATGDSIFIDVTQLHEAAGDALSEGKNPYSTGNVAVVESHPFGGNEVIQEYTYPPLAMVAYGGSAALFGDSRVVGALAISAAFFMVFAFAAERWGSEREAGHVDAVAVALLCANPMTLLIIFAGWTEAIAVPLLAGAAFYWRDRPIASAVLLGLGLATKQYFLVAAPALLFIPDAYRWRRVAVAGATAFLTYLPFLIWDAGGLINGVVRHHLTRAPRPDSATLAGIGIHVPTAVAVGVAVLAGVIIARRVKSGGQLLLALAASLGVFTFLSVRGFRNSWWLVVVLVSVAMVVDRGGSGGQSTGPQERNPRDSSGAIGSQSVP